MRPSKAIRARTTREIRRAARHAHRIGRDLTHYVVLNFDPPAIGDELKPQRSFSAIRKKCWTWWQYKRRTNPGMGPMTDVRTWENKSGILHVNWLVRVPAGCQLEFERKLQGWVEKAIPGHQPGALNVEAIYNLNGVLDYALKGTEAGYAAQVGIDHEDQGVIWGRRASASISLGRSARDRDWQNGAVIKKGWKFRKPNQHA